MGDQIMSGNLNSSHPFRSRTLESLANVLAELGQFQQADRALGIALEALTSNVRIPCESRVDLLSRRTIYRLAHNSEESIACSPDPIRVDYHSWAWRQSLHGSSNRLGARGCLLAHRVSRKGLRPDKVRDFWIQQFHGRYKPGILRNIHSSGKTCEEKRP